MSICLLSTIYDLQEVNTISTVLTLSYAGQGRELEVHGMR